MSIQAAQPLNEIYNRLNNEAQIQSNLPSVLSKLQTEESLPKFYADFYTQFKNEIQYTIKVLSYLRKKSFTNEPSIDPTNTANLDNFDQKEQLINNVYIFKENFRSILYIVIEDLWNNVITHQLLDEMINKSSNEHHKTNQNSDSKNEFKGSLYNLNQKNNSCQNESPEIHNNKNLLDINNQNNLTDPTSINNGKQSILQKSESLLYETQNLIQEKNFLNICNENHFSDKSDLFSDIKQIPTISEKVIKQCFEIKEEIEEDDEEECNITNNFNLRESHSHENAHEIEFSLENYTSTEKTKKAGNSQNNTAKINKSIDNLSIDKNANTILEKNCNLIFTSVDTLYDQTENVDRNEFKEIILIKDSNTDRCPRSTLTNISNVKHDHKETAILPVINDLINVKVEKSVVSKNDETSSNFINQNHLNQTFSSSECSMRIKNDTSLNTLTLEGNKINLLTTSNTPAKFQHNEESAAPVNEDQKPYRFKNTELDSKRIMTSSIDCKKEINFNKILIDEPFLATGSTSKEIFEENKIHHSDIDLSKDNKSTNLIRDNCSDSLQKPNTFSLNREKEELYKYIEKLKLLGDEQYDIEDKSRIQELQSINDDIKRYTIRSSFRTDKEILIKSQNIENLDENIFMSSPEKVMKKVEFNKHDDFGSTIENNIKTLKKSASGKF